MKTVSGRLLMLLASLLASHPAAAAVYKCTDAADKVTYQSQPCPDASGTRAVPVDTAPAARPSAVPPRPRQDDAWHIATLDGDVAAPAAPAPNDRSQRPPERPALPEAPRARLNFDLLSVKGARLAWTNTGPRDTRRHDGQVRGGSGAEDPQGAAAVNDNGTEAYELQGDTLVWMPKGFGGPKQNLQPPARLPRLSWASGIAWDTRNGVLAIVSGNSEGVLHRYDTRKHVWLDARQLRQRDLLSLAFDAATGNYVAITQKAELVTFNADGSVQRVQPLADQLAGLRNTFDQDTPHVAGLTLAAQGGIVAIVNVRKASVTHIWTYDARSNRAQLTYKATL